MLTVFKDHSGTHRFRLDSTDFRRAREVLPDLDNATVVVASGFNDPIPVNPESEVLRWLSQRRLAEKPKPYWGRCFSHDFLVWPGVAGSIESGPPPPLELRSISLVEEWNVLVPQTIGLRQWLTHYGISWPGPRIPDNINLQDIAS